MNKPLDEAQQKFLLGLARRAVEHYLKNHEKLNLRVEDKTFQEKRGAFVTLKVHDELRGCIGYPLPYKPLAETIVDVAVAAATEDYRFDSLGLDELPDVKFEISVLSLPERVKDAKAIEVGKHGIIISKGFRKGLLLPQVPLEYNWDLETYLRHGCLKAGLAEDEWKKGVKIETFTAQVFSE
jgi:AmmeMemoRadiSam system protein A